MTKKKKKKSFIKGFATTGLTLGASSLAVASLPSTSGTAPIKTSILKGQANFAGAFPTIGRLGGTAMTIGVAGKVVKATKKLGKRRRKKK